MTDRELLEWAAKAAGLQNAKPAMGCGIVHGGGMYWNPLADDGQALRLAVALGLVVDCSRPSAGPPFYSHLHAEIAMKDRDAATRRAIVRAAAEIGRAFTGEKP